ncbi:Ribonuclease Z [archaeon HR06]|nr:Ribonuclease Z [archaeon HR06]
MKIFITHMHGDHCIGLLGLIQTMSMLNRRLPLNIYGPSKLDEFIHFNLRLLNLDIPFPLYIKKVKEGIIVEEKDYKVEAISSEHSIESYSYLLKEKDRPGKFYPEKAKALGVPEGFLWSLLQKGISVKINNNIIKPEQVLGEARKGRTIGISGDTRPNERLVNFFKDCDVLIFDSTYSSEYQEKAIVNKHSTAREAAELALKANVKLLILTHFSARYDDTKVLLEEAKSIHPNVMVAKDFMILEVPYEEKSLVS